MRRRTLIAGLGAVTAGASTLVGSGAFTSISADRSVSVTVAGDADAFLRLTPIDDATGRSGTATDGTVTFDIPGDGTAESDSATGVGVDSEYRFYDLVEIENQGTQAADVYSTYDASAGSLNDLALLDGDLSGNEILDAGNAQTLGVGESVTAGLYIDTTGTPTDANGYEETLTIVAERASN